MTLGGWWRLWISLSVLWVVGALALNLSDRPTDDQVNRDVALSCEVESPITDEYARVALQMRSLLDELAMADAANDTTKAHRLAAEIVRLREKWTKSNGTLTKYSRYSVVDPEGMRHTAIAPAMSTNEAVLEQVDKDTRNANNWAHFSTYCVEQLKRHATGELYREREKGWLWGTVFGTLLLPVALIVIGLIVGWVWRGFRKPPTR